MKVTTHTALAAALTGALLAGLCCLPAIADEATPPARDKIYAQALVDKVIAQHPELAVLALHVTPPKSTENVIIASNIGRIGKEADEDDLRVIKTGKPNLAVNGNGTQFEVELPLLDANRRIVGAAGIVFHYQPGDDQKKMADRAVLIRDTLARRISHVANLMEPAVVDSSIPTENFGQSLVDQLLEQHKNVVILALHVPTDHNPDYPIIASNIGRIGKKADEDDMHVITSGESKLEFNETGDRFEVEHPLLDQTGATIGAVGVVFPFHKGVDQKRLKKEADAIQLALKSQIANRAALLLPAPPLRKISFTELPGYEGDFDHIMADLPGNRLLLAAEDHGTIELFTLDKVSHVKTIAGVETPHAFLPLPKQNLLVVTDSGKGGSKLFDYRRLTSKGGLKGLGLGADSMEYDSISNHALINTGGKDADMTEAFLEEIDPVSGQSFGKVKFASNSLQSLAITPDGKKIFVMDQGNNKLVTVDHQSHKIIAEWPIADVGQAAMVQYDGSTHRLFVGTRKPGKMIVLDADSGAVIVSFTAPEKTDQLIFDKGSKRIYMLGGDGNIAIYQQQDADHYTELARVPSAEGAKTGLLVPELHRLFVAVSPGEGKSSGGGILQFAVE